MKTIGKKVKAIYTLAVIALVSICMSFIPLMTNTVKADVETSTTGLRITGAQVKVVDEAYKPYVDPQDEFALYFHAEITEEFYNTLKTGEQDVQFGMLIGPSAMINGFGSYTAKAVEEFDGEVGEVVTEGNLTDVNKAANFRFVGTGLQEEVEFTKGIKTFEAGVVFNTTELANESGLAEDVVAKLAASTDLTAIPYYVVDGLVTMNALDVATRNAKDVLVETAVRINNECSDSDIDKATIDALIAKYVGAVEYLEGEVYFDLNTGKFFAPNENNELVDFSGSEFMQGEVVIAGGATADTYKEGSFIGIAKTENGEVEVLSARVATRVIATLGDFFNGSIAPANYIFKLQCAGSGNHTVENTITGYYVLANNIDASSAGDALNAAYGEFRPYIPSDTYYNSGNRMTFDGRGFAISNIKTFSTAGMFAMLNSATIKNVAFVEIHNTRNDGNANLLAYSTYRSTIENVYIRTAVTSNSANDNYNGAVNPFGTKNELGPSTFTNVVFENTVALIDGYTGKHIRATFGSDDKSNYENVNIIGLPTAFSAPVPQVSKVTSEDGTLVEYTYHGDTLKLTMPLSVIKSYVGEENGAGVYNLADCGVAKTQFAALISNLNTKFTYNTSSTKEGVTTKSYYTLDIKKIEFIEDKVRGYYYDNAALSADSTTAKLYEDTGCWVMIGDQLLWNSLVDQSAFVVKSNNLVPTDFTFTDNIELSMFYGEKELDATITVSDAGLEFVDVVDNKLTLKPGVRVYTDTTFAVTLEFAGFVKTVDVTILYDIDKVDTYESGEFIIDKNTGKVLKANANNELVAYDATSYLAGSDTLTINGVAQTIANIAEFAVDNANLTSLADGEKYIIAAGENNLVAKLVTKVLSSKNDFFVDENADGTLSNTEYIFHQNVSGGTLTTLYDGYYVLANNIEFGNTNVRVCANDGKPSIVDNLGFQGTFDGRGFAISNIYVCGNAGLFGVLNNATIKDLAINGINVASGDDSTLTMIAYRTKDTKLENVYILPNILPQSYANYVGSMTYFGNISGTNYFKNVVLENTYGTTVANKADGRQLKYITWHVDSLADTVYTNTSVVGVPSAIGWAKHATDTSKQVLTIALSSAEISKLGVAAATYALNDCPTLVAQYKNVITAIELNKKVTIGYIKVVEENRFSYEYDNASLSANETLASEYVSTGRWTKLGDSLVWTSLIDANNFVVKSDKENNVFADTTNVDMYYNGVVVPNGNVTISDADKEYVSLNGNTLTKIKYIESDRVIAVTIEIVVNGVTITKTANITLSSAAINMNTLDGENKEVYVEEGVVKYDTREDNTVSADGSVTGITNAKVGAAGVTYTTYDNGRIVGLPASAVEVLKNATSIAVYDGATELAYRTAQTPDQTDDESALDFYVDGVTGKTLGSTTNKLTIITELNKYELTYMYVTRAISNITDFSFTRTAAPVCATSTKGSATWHTYTTDYIFEQYFPKTGSVSDSREPFNIINGYYVLANNVDANWTVLQSMLDTNLGWGITSGEDIDGFNATLDGRGYTLSNVTTGKGGLFGVMRGATIKNIAFNGLRQGHYASAQLFAAGAYGVQMQNCYVKLAPCSNGGATDGYRTNLFGYYTSSVVYKSVVMEDWLTSATMKVGSNDWRFAIGASSYVQDFYLIGNLPLATPIAGSTTESGKNTLTLTVTVDELNAIVAANPDLGIVTGQEYLLRDEEGNIMPGLELYHEHIIGSEENIVARQKKALTYVKFSTMSGLDGHALRRATSSQQLASMLTYNEKARFDTRTGFAGCWTITSDNIVWKTLPLGNN